ncbi:MAG: O-antigen ligase family protein [Flavobacteriia bacterium]|nr:O-antigen ligase family protein [Flavobacteriia bacterium]
MIQTFREYRLLIILVSLFIFVSLFFVSNNNWIPFAVPLVFLALYFIFFNAKWIFLLLYFLTPLSINIEEYSESIGLFIPTEPILILFLLLILALILFRGLKYKWLWTNPLIYILVLYILVLFISSTTSEYPLVSFKYLFMKLWYIIPIFYLACTYLQSSKNIEIILWMFSSGMVIVMIYTLVHHSLYQFAEKPSHWVMSPFFKDHTIYGAMVAFTVPLIVSLFFYKKRHPLLQAVLISFFVINLIALYFSFTRAAWLSIVVSLAFYFIIYWRIKLSFLLSIIVFLSIIVYFSWTPIQHALEKNKSEHTTEEFSKRLESVSNVTTDASNLERLNRWDCAWQMFQERPILGFGPGTYAFEYARFQKANNLTIISTNFGDGGNAHSEYLGPLSETGIVGFLLTIALIISFFYYGIKSYYKLKNEQSPLKTLILGMVLALSTYFFHGILNNYWDTDKASIPIWTMSVVFLIVFNGKIIEKK